MSPTHCRYRAWLHGALGIALALTLAGVPAPNTASATAAGPRDGSTVLAVTYGGGGSLVCAGADGTGRVAASFAFDPSSGVARGASVWVTSDRSSNPPLAPVEIASGAVGDPVDVGDPAHVVVGGDRGPLWVGTLEGALVAIDPSTRREVARLDPPTFSAHLATNGRVLWVADEQGTVRRYDGRSGQPDDMVLQFAGAGGDPAAVGAIATNRDGDLWLAFSSRQRARARQRADEHGRRPHPVRAPGRSQQRAPARHRARGRRSVRLDRHGRLRRDARRAHPRAGRPADRQGAVVHRSRRAPGREDRGDGTRRVARRKRDPALRSGHEQGDRGIGAVRHRRRAVPASVPGSGARAACGGTWRARRRPAPGRAAESGGAGRGRLRDTRRDRAPARVRRAGPVQGPDGHPVPARALQPGRRSSGDVCLRARIHAGRSGERAPGDLGLAGRSGERDLRSRSTNRRRMQEDDDSRHHVRAHRAAGAPGRSRRRAPRPLPLGRERPGVRDQRCPDPEGPVPVPRQRRDPAAPRSRSKRQPRSPAWRSRDDQRKDPPARRRSRPRGRGCLRLGARHRQPRARSAVQLGVRVPAADRAARRRQAELPRHHQLAVVRRNRGLRGRDDDPDCARGAVRAHLHRAGDLHGQQHRLRRGFHGRRRHRSLRREPLRDHDRDRVPARRRG